MEYGIRIRAVDDLLTLQHRAIKRRALATLASIDRELQRRGIVVASEKREA